MKSIKNKRALFEYYIDQKFEAGIALKGSEIKSIRAGKVSFTDSYAKIIQNECILLNLHIAPWEQASYQNHEAERPRRLLLHAHEIRRLKTKTEEQGMTIVPLEIYINEKGRCKLTIALAKGKKLHDKRDSLKERSLEREKNSR